MFNYASLKVCTEVKLSKSSLSSFQIFNPILLPDLYFDSFSYSVASIVLGDMAIVSLFLLLYL